MAAMDFFSQFETLWAQTGQVEAIEDNQYKAGWAYIGATPPSVEQFNKVQQLTDQKAAWLFAQIKALSTALDYAIAAGQTDALIQAFNRYARLDGATFTGPVAVPTAAVGDNDTSAASTAFVQSSVNGRLSKSVAGTGTVTLTATEAGYAILEFTGALTGNRTVVVPTVAGRWVVLNKTTGAFSLTVKTAAGTGIVVAQGKNTELVCDGTNVLEAKTTAPTAAGGSNDTSIATTAFANRTGGVVGGMRNASMTIAAASPTATFTADEVVVTTALGGAPIRLANVNKTINLGTSGPGGMVAAPAPVSTWIAIYLIYNPSTGASALLGVPTPSAPAPEVCAPANLSNGYTASALVSVVTTDPAGLFKVFTQRDRKVVFPGIGVFNTQTDNASFQPISLAGAVPPNAKSAGGYGDAALTVGGTINFAFASDATGMGNQTFNSSCSVAYGHSLVWTDIPLATQQTIYIYRNAVLNGTGVRQYTAYCSSYTF